MRCALALAAMLAAATPAAGQSVTIVVDGRAMEDVVRDITRAVTATVGPLTSGLGTGLREALGDVKVGLDDLGALAKAARQNRNFKVQQTARETRTLAIGASGTLDLDTLSGDITVTAGGTRDATIEIVRVSHGRTDADAKLGLDRVKVDINDRPDRARVRLIYPDQRNPPYSVDVSYIVTAAPGTRVSARTLSGKIVVKGIRGDVEANVTSGRIDINESRVSQAKTVSGDVSLVDADTDGSLDIRTVSGDVMLQNVKARRLTADAVGSGSVTSRGVTADNVSLSALNGDIAFTGPLSKTGRYEVKTFSGSIRFTPSAPTGFELQASTFSGSIRPDPSMTFHGLSISRRSLRGTFGDGAATVTLQTFSGNITIGK